MRMALVLLSILLLSPLARAGDGRVVQDPGKDTPEWVILKTLEAGVGDDFEGWYKNLCHTDYCLNTPVNVREFQKYRWKQFLKWAPTYFKDAARKSFEVTGTNPTTLDAGTSEVKFFLRNSKRDNPVPIILKKDDKGAWKVFNMSL